MSGRYLVLGGAGYIGSHMVALLRDRGHAVTVFDNLSRGHADAVGNAELVVGDLRDPAALSNCLASAEFECVMHFAALAYVGESVERPGAYYDNNVGGTRVLLDCLADAGSPALVFSSTCATYGEPACLPIREGDPQRPVNPYGRTKLVCEAMIADYAAAHGLRAIVLRYFNAAGCDRQGRLGERHDPETHLIPLVLREAARLRAGGDPDQTGLRIFGADFATADGTCVRDYIHVEDLAAAHLAAAARLRMLDAGTTEAFNLGNGHGFSVLDVIASARRVTGQSIGYRLDPRRAGDPATLVSDATRARDLLGWTPRIPDLDTIVASAWDWMLAHETVGPGARR